MRELAQLLKTSFMALLTLKCLLSTASLNSLHTALNESVDVEKGFIHAKKLGATKSSDKRNIIAQNVMSSFGIEPRVQIPRTSPRCTPPKKELSEAFFKKLGGHVSRGSFQKQWRRSFTISSRALIPHEELR